MMSAIIKKLRDALITLKIRHSGNIIHRSVKFREPQYLSLGENANIGENSYLYCWGNYRNDRVNQLLSPSLEIGKNFSATRRLTIQCCNHITIGDDVLIASDVFICDYNHGMQPNADSYLFNELLLSEVTIENGAWIGQGVFILPGAYIGGHSIVGAGSVVTKKIPPYCLAVGNPARVIKRFDPGTQKWEKYSE